MPNLKFLAPTVPEIEMTFLASFYKQPSSHTPSLPFHMIVCPVLL